MKFKTCFCLLSCLMSLSAMAQEESKFGEFSGNFQSNTQIYLRDDRIGANTTQYLREKSSTDAWLFLNYKVAGFDINARYDVFNNTPLLNPQQAYTNSGIGYWNVGRRVGALHLTAGYFYDQIGSGTAFRAYEDRLIGIDYAVRGVKVQYDLSETWMIKAFTGQQKGFLNLSNNEDSRFSVTPQVVKGINTEKRFNLSEQFSIDVGTGLVNRTLDGSTINGLVTEINSLPLEQRFQPKSNTYIYTGYFTVNYKGFSWNAEYVGKTAEALRNPFSSRLFSSNGNVYFTSLGYSKTGLGINLQYKRVENFQFRNSPNYILLNGLVTYLPSITRQNVYRLLARYNPVVQELGENAFQADVVWSPSKKLTINANFSYVDAAYGEREHLFEEYYLEGVFKLNKKTKIQLGIQSVFYNQKVYELNPKAPNVRTITPFTDITYKLTSRQSIRFEAQYLHSEQDLGSFVNALVEYNIAPNWSFSVGDMVNVNPVRTPETPQEVISDDIVHYYNFFVAYNYRNTRFTANYLKQVQGVNCTGGICRVEPAFSGFRFGLTTNF